MLFYHRVEPRTGCWEVSASVRPSVHTPPTSSHTPPGELNGLWYCWFWCWFFWCFIPCLFLLCISASSICPHVTCVQHGLSHFFMWCRKLCPVSLQGNGSRLCPEFEMFLSSLFGSKQNVSCGTGASDVTLQLVSRPATEICRRIDETCFVLCLWLQLQFFSPVVPLPSSCCPIKCTAQTENHQQYLLLFIILNQHV